jgi:hypothetical protein
VKTVEPEPSMVNIIEGEDTNQDIPLQSLQARQQHKVGLNAAKSESISGDRG